jgi:hypothetical protein
MIPLYGVLDEGSGGGSVLTIGIVLCEVLIYSIVIK